MIVSSISIGSNSMVMKGWGWKVKKG